MAHPLISHRTVAGWRSASHRRSSGQRGFVTDRGAAALASSAPTAEGGALVGNHAGAPMKCAVGFSRHRGS